MKPKYTMHHIVHMAMKEKGFEHYSQLAKYLGITKGAVSAWLQSQGFHKPHQATRIKLAEAAKVTVKDIDQAVALQKIKHMRRKLELMREHITMIR